MVGAGLRVAGPVLDPLALAVLAPVPRLRVGALAVGELHPSPARPGAAPPGSPGAPAAVHKHLQQKQAGVKRQQPKTNSAVQPRPQSGPAGPAAAGAPPPQAKCVLKFGTRGRRPLPAFLPHVSLSSGAKAESVGVPSTG